MVGSAARQAPVGSDTDVVGSGVGVPVGVTVGVGVSGRGVGVGVSGRGVLVGLSGRGVLVGLSGCGVRVGLLVAVALSTATAVVGVGRRLPVTIEPSPASTTQTR